MERNNDRLAHELARGLRNEALIAALTAEVAKVAAALNDILYVMKAARADHHPARMPGEGPPAAYPPAARGHLTDD
jgi:hypothetical protein